MISQIIDQLGLCHFCQNSLSVFYLSKQIAIPKIYCQDIRKDFKKIQVPTFITSNVWEEVLDNGRSCSALLADLSKAFDCKIYDFLLAKLSTYGFHYNSLKLINNLLSGRKFRTKTGSSYSPYLDLLVGTPQRSTLDPLLGMIFFYESVNLTS